MPKFFAGIGSRETPADKLSVLWNLSSLAVSHNYILRSGCAVGADTACESSVRGFGGEMELFVVNKPYRTYKSARYFVFEELPKSVQDKALLLASVIHPAWHRCTPYVRMLHARNVCQIWGADLNTPVDFVLCWARVTQDTVSGGTRQAVEVAKHAGIPVYNLALESSAQTFYDLLH